MVGPQNKRNQKEFWLLKQFFFEVGVLTKGTCSNDTGGTDASKKARISWSKHPRWNWSLISLSAAAKSFWGTDRFSWSMIAKNPPQEAWMTQASFCPHAFLATARSQSSHKRWMNKRTLNASQPAGNTRVKQKTNKHVKIPSKFGLCFLCVAQFLDNVFCGFTQSSYGALSFLLWKHDYCLLPF